MTLRPEFALIERIQKAAGGSSRVPLGIGDDAAGLACRDDRETLVATDMLLDGVHFVVEECGPYWAGRKALAVNLSDLAAMGGGAWPRLFRSPSREIGTPAKRMN